MRPITMRDLSLALCISQQSPPAIEADQSADEKTGTLNAEAVAQWAPALPVSVNVELFNLDRSLLNYTYRLASSVTPGASSRTFIAGFP